MSKTRVVQFSGVGVEVQEGGVSSGGWWGEEAEVRQITRNV